MRQSQKIRLAEAELNRAKAELRALKEDARAPYQKFIVVSSKNGKLFEAIYRTKTDMIRAVSFIVGRDPEIESTETLPQIVDEQLAEEYPIVIDAWGGNPDWNYDVFERLHGKLGWAIGNKKGTYIVKDIETVERALNSDIVLARLEVRSETAFDHLGEPILHEPLIRRLYR